MTHTTADVAVIGAGMAGLTAALHLADTGLDVVLCADVRAGEASPAAGGILDTGHGFASPDVQALMRDARDRWPAFAAALTERTGVAIPVNRDGILELAHAIHDAERLGKQVAPDIEWLDASALTAREPALTHVVGALHFRHDGAVNPLLVLRALKQAVGHHVHLRVIQQTVSALDTGTPGSAVTLTLADESTLSAMRVIVATGAWATTLPGIPTALPVAPLRGQLMSVASKTLRHVTFMNGGYVIPRGDGRTILGGTEEHAGFDASHSEDGVRHIRALAGAIHPSLATAPMLNTWSGLRPMTPDALPIIGPDPEHPSVIHATGLGRNGILLAPMVGALAAACARGDAETTVPGPFRPERFR